MPTFTLPKRPSVLELTDIKDKYFASQILTIFLNKFEKTIFNFLKKSPTQIVCLNLESNKQENVNIANITAINQKLFDENSIKLINSNVSAQCIEERLTQQQHSFKPKIFEMSVDNGPLYVCVKKEFNITELFLEKLFSTNASEDYIDLRRKLRNELGFVNDVDFQNSLLRCKIYDPSKTSKINSMRAFYDKLKNVFRNSVPKQISGFEYLACLNKDNRFEMHLCRSIRDWTTLTSTLAESRDINTQNEFYLAFENLSPIAKATISEKLREWLEEFRIFETSLKDLLYNQMSKQGFDIGSVYFHIRRFYTEARLEMSNIKNDFGKIPLTEFDDNSPLFEKVSKESSSMKSCYMHYDFKKISDIAFSKTYQNQDDLNKKYIITIKDLFFPQSYSPTNFFEKWYDEERSLEMLYELVKETFTSEASQKDLRSMLKYQIRGVCATKQELFEYLKTEESADKGFFGGVLQAAKAELEVKQGIVDACSNKQIKDELEKTLEIEKSKTYYNNLQITLQQNSQEFERIDQQDNTNFNELVDDFNIQNDESNSPVQASRRPVRRRSLKR